MDTPKNGHLTQNERDLLEAAEMLWVLLANVSVGDWSHQPYEWRKAAAKARDDFHAVAKRLNAKTV